MRNDQVGPILLSARSNLGIWLQASFWLFIFLLHVLLVSNSTTLEIAFYRSILNLIPMLGLFYVNTWLVDRYFEHGKVLIYLGLAFLLLLTISFIRVQINMRFPQIGKGVLLLDSTQTLRVGALLTNSLILLLSTFYRLLENRNRRERKFQSIRESQQVAQLQFLRAQINPHFLFNTLNNIYALAVMQSEKTAPMVLELSKLLRYVLYESQHDQVYLHKEIDQLEKFIDLFQMRSESPLDITFEIIGSPGNIQIEPMLLIPILENCFKHCDFDSNPAAYAKLKLEITDQYWFFTAVNSFNPNDQQKDKIGGVGLANIRSRMELKYPGKYNLEIAAEGKVFNVSLGFENKNE